MEHLLRLNAFQMNRVLSGTHNTTSVDYPYIPYSPTFLLRREMLKNSQYLAQDTDVLHVANMMTRFGWGDGTNDSDKDVQCNLLEEDAGHCSDPSRLPYKERLRWHFKQFCYKTSSHGIPMLGQAPNVFYRAVWIFLLLMCAGTFIYQACSVVEKYQRMGKITDIQLKFDTAPFPAITICNLNPYKDSLLQNVKTIKKILNVFNDVMEKAGKHNLLDKDEDEVAEEPTESPHKRKKRAAAMFEPAYSDCRCVESDGTVECAANTTKKPTDTTCLCAFDRDSGDAWPCYPKETWNEEMCDFCDDHNYCTKQTTETLIKSSERKPCLCQTLNPFCVAFDSTSTILKLWEYYGLIEVDEAKVLEALGFQDMNDEVAIVTKAKENIIFAMSKLSRNQRIALSIQKHQLLHKCSFNGIACDIDRDFLIVDDPTFGNCFMFNHNRSEIKSSLRAGPMYGLRILVYVNATEYLPTTEAVGIRITIHDKDDFPFPDTFGYSAPTGYISSFGMRMSKMSRLPAPYGDCVPNGLTTNYIYEGFRYSTEGCYRTCFQDLVVKDCGCGDPRFPVLKGAVHCEVFNPESRKCLERRTSDLSNVHGSFRCRCQQPCDQSVYTVSYSAAKWPSQSLNISLGNCELSPEECNEHYQENGAMIEVFYEALNFEVFSESEAYGVVKMLADFGGQLGLWSGVSFLTCCEFVFLFFETIYMVFHHHYMQYKKRKEDEEEALHKF